jgi:hypothetical protein
MIGRKPPERGRTASVAASDSVLSGLWPASVPALDAAHLAVFVGGSPSSALRNRHTGGG